MASSSWVSWCVLGRSIEHTLCSFPGQSLPEVSCGSGQKIATTPAVTPTTYLLQDQKETFRNSSVMVIPTEIIVITEIVATLYFQGNHVLSSGLICQTMTQINKVFALSVLNITFRNCCESWCEPTAQNCILLYWATLWRIMSLYYKSNLQFRRKLHSF